MFTQSEQLNELCGQATYQCFIALKHLLQNQMNQSNREVIINSGNNQCLIGLLIKYRNNNLNMMANNSKKVQFDKIQRPKTLVVVHYKGKRVTIPLFQSIQNITQYLCHQLYKFEATILQKQGQKQKDNGKVYSVNDIICFSSFQQQKNTLDLKMNLILSFSRMKKDFGKSRMDLQEIDITNYYKYLQIQPVYGSSAKQLIPQYNLFSILNAGQYYTTYLGRRISDGRFYTVKICRNDTKISQNEYNSMKILLNEQSQYQSKRQLQLIPQIEEVRRAEGLYIYIYEFCPGGNLRHALRKKLPEIQCLHYMKQLVWGVYTLHTSFNLIHRAICFENLELDFVGNLRLVNYANCQPCYSNSYIAHSKHPQSYQQRYEIQNVVTPPQVQRSSRYNNLVDYYGIGTILCEMFIESYSRQKQKKGQKQGIQVVIQNFMADNIRDRQLFVNQVIAELHRQKRKSNSNKIVETIEQNQRLTINKIYIGESINIQEKVYNGIRHQQALRLMKPTHDDQVYYLNPMKKNLKKSKSKNKSKSKSKSKDKNKENSEEKKQPKDKSKSKSKKDKIQSNSLAGSQQSGKTKISKNSSQKSLNKSLQSHKNSAKSRQSTQMMKGQKKESRQKIKRYTDNRTQPPLIPKMPQNKSLVEGIKSPVKTVKCESTNYHELKISQSPPKLSINKKSYTKI